ncbi:MAG: hypothetical protein Q9225_004987 [Loekoesia sp. 1 TL-2023]
MTETSFTWVAERSLRLVLIGIAKPVLDVKANNVVVELRQDANQLVLEQVQLADLEDAAHVPPGMSIYGLQTGNYMWRSPEAHASHYVNKPSDMFSFGIVCVYAVRKRVIFAINEEKLEEGVDPLAVVLRRQISYFADPAGLLGFLNYIGEESPWFEVFGDIIDKSPRQPFYLWKGWEDVDKDFKDLVGRLTNFDPAKRITAREALEHPWFKGVW